MSETRERGDGRIYTRPPADPHTYRTPGRRGRQDRHAGLYPITPNSVGTTERTREKEGVEPKGVEPSTS